MKSKIAIIDCGTNTFNLLIASQNESGFTVHFEDERSVRIGDQGISKGIITSNAMNRALTTLMDFTQIVHKHEVADHNIYAFATSAFRNAQNSPKLIDDVLKASGIEIQVIDGSKEAELIFFGVSRAIDISDKVLVMDIGGGSVEFIIGDSKKIYWKKSFEIGAQRLVDLFHHNDPITDQELSEIDKYLKNQLSILFNKLNEHKPQILIGASGTFETLSNIYTFHNNQKNTSASELPFDFSFYPKIHNELIIKNQEQRAEIPGMSLMRIDMIVVASCIINSILTRYQFDKFRISNYALKEGAIFQLLDTIDKTN